MATAARESGRMTIAERRAQLDRGELTSRELIEEVLARIADPAGEGALAFTDVFADAARAAADVADLQRRAGYVASPLAGLPVSLKDLFDVAGRPTRAASAVLTDAPPAVHDAAIVARLRRAGAVLVGKTNMTEFAYSGLGINPHFGTPRSPYDRATGRVAGGSSSGAAVSVADGMAVAGIGTDTGGSTRIPAAFCGLAGFKPTARRVPITGAYPLSFSLDSVGPMARSVACCATVDAILAGDEPRELTPAPLRGLRLLAPPNYVRDGLDAAVDAAFAGVIEALRTVGAIVDERRLEVLERIPALQVHGGLPGAEAHWWHRKQLEERPEAYDPQIARRIRRGGAISAWEYIDLLRGRQAAVTDFARESEGYDALLWPTVAIVPPPIAPLLADGDLYARVNLLVLRNTSVINVVDGCALSVPVPAPGGAPVGVMLAGRGGDDARILRIGAALEALLRG